MEISSKDKELRKISSVTSSSIQHKRGHTGETKKNTTDGIIKCKKCGQNLKSQSHKASKQRP